MLANLRQSSSIKLFATAIRGEYGASAEVEVSAVTLTDSDDRPGIGFAIRNVEKRLSAAATSTRELPRSMAQLIELIGRVPLRDLVRETTDVIEKLSIEGEQPPAPGGSSDSIGRSRIANRAKCSVTNDWSPIATTGTRT